MGQYIQRHCFISRKNFFKITLLCIDDYKTKLIIMVHTSATTTNINSEQYGTRDEGHNMKSIVLNHYCFILYSGTMGNVWGIWYVFLTCMPNNRWEPNDHVTRTQLWHYSCADQESFVRGGSKKWVLQCIRKYHNHKLQTTPWHRENEPHNNHETPGRQKSKLTDSLFPTKMIAKLECTTKHRTIFLITFFSSSFY